MTSPTFDQSKVTQFAKAVTELATQTDSFLSPYVNVENVTGDIFEVQTVGAISAKPQTHYNQDIEASDIVHTRRGKNLQTWYTAAHYDGKQKVEALIDINGAYTREVANAMIRKKDEIIIAGALGSYLTGAKFEQTVAWSDVTSGLSQNVVDLSGSALNLAGCYTIAELFMSRGHGLFNNKKIYMTITEKQAMDLAKEANSAAKQLFPVGIDPSTGKVNNAGPVNFIVIPSNPAKGDGLLKNVSSKLVGLAFVQGGITLGMSLEMPTKVVELQQKINTIQISSSFSLDALRVSDDQVIKVLFQPKTA